MALQHGINTYKDDTASTVVIAADVGIPFFIGAAPCHCGNGFAGKPQIATNFAEAKEQLGYSTEWRNADGTPKFNLCQAMYAFHKLMGMSPAVYYNIYDPSKHKKAVPAESVAVTDHIAELPLDAIVNNNLIVKATDTLVKGTDYEAYYTDTALCIELLSESASYAASALTISYDVADLSTITAEDIEEAVEMIELCRNAVGVVPDLICAPGWSKNPSVAAVMAAKAPSINGLFRAKAVVDLDTTIATDYSKVLAAKNDNGYTFEDMIVCWPMVGSDNYVFDLSTIVCGLIAKVDAGNSACPYESPSNKSIPITSSILANGTEVNLSLPQADIISVSDGVVTAINCGGWSLWGNYLGCYPTSTDIAKVFICTNRVQDWICNTFVTMFWKYIDKPLTPALRDAIINAFNAWLNGLTAEGKLYGGEISYSAELNPISNLVNGMFRLDCTAASPVPAQRIDMHVQYSVDMLESAMSS